MVLPPEFTHPTRREYTSSTADGGIGKIKGIRSYMLPKPLGWLKGCFESGLSAPAKQKQIQRNNFDVMLCVCEVKPLPN